MAKPVDAKFVVGRNIRRLREESGKTQISLCGSIGMSRAFWNEVEKGNQDPSTSTLARIAKALGVTIRDLYDEPANGRKRRETAGARK